MLLPPHSICWGWRFVLIRGLYWLALLSLAVQKGTNWQWANESPSIYLLLVLQLPLPTPSPLSRLLCHCCSPLYLIFHCISHCASCSLVFFLFLFLLPLAVQAYWAVPSHLSFLSRAYRRWITTDRHYGFSTCLWQWVEPSSHWTRAPFQWDVSFSSSPCHTANVSWLTLSHIVKKKKKKKWRWIISSEQVQHWIGNVSVGSFRGYTLTDRKFVSKLVFAPMWQPY